MEDFSPRRDDHLVEPMFAGLGVGEERGEEAETGEAARPCEPESRAPRRSAGLWRRLRDWLLG